MPNFGPTLKSKATEDWQHLRVHIHFHVPLTFFSRSTASHSSITLFFPLLIYLYVDTITYVPDFPLFAHLCPASNPLPLDLTTLLSVSTGYSLHLLPSSPSQPPPLYFLPVLLPEMYVVTPLKMLSGHFFQTYSQLGMCIPHTHP